MSVALLLLLLLLLSAASARAIDRSGAGAAAAPLGAASQDGGAAAAQLSGCGARCDEPLDHVDLQLPPPGPQLQAAAAAAAAAAATSPRVPGEPRSTAAAAAAQAAADGLLGAVPVDGEGSDADPPPSDAFKLHSRPGAYFVAWLDFQGSTLTYRPGDIWYQMTGPNTNDSRKIITTPAYDLDGDPGSFSERELRYIVAAWRAVAEDYAIFNIDITTERPAFSLASRGQRVVIGGMPTWLLHPANGIALTNGFGYKGSDGEPPAAFVFSSRFGGAPRGVADTASHELGHTIGLSHDGSYDPPATYYPGHAVPYAGPDGARRNGTTWAPIMGRAIFSEVSQWSKGEYPSANNQQDQLGTLAWLGLVPDEHGGTRELATPLRVGTAAPTVVRSLINAPGDSDVFAFYAPAGALRVALALVPLVDPPYSWTNASSGGVIADPTTRANLDAEIKVESEGGGQVAEITDDAGLLSGAWEVQLPAQGRYYVSVTGVGSPVTPWGQGYTSYGSVGQYKLSLRGAWPAGAVVCKSPTLQLPQAAPGAGCGRVVLGAGDLYESEGPVSFSPDLPGVWPLVMNATFEVKSLVTGGDACTSRVVITPCPPRCKGGDGGVAVRLPQPGGNCSAAVISNYTDLFEADVPVSIDPPADLPLTIPAGTSSSYRVTAQGGASCTARVAAVPCAPTCANGGSLAVQLPQPSGGCGGAVLSREDLFNAADAANATLQPPLPQAVPPGTSSFVVTNAAGACSISVAVGACTGRYLRVQLAGYQASPRGSGGRWQVRQVRLLVKDEAGAPMPGATVKLEWQLDPGAAAAAAGNRAAPRRLPAATRRGDAGGAVVVSSPKVLGGRLRLRVVSVTAKARAGQGAPYKWDDRPPNFVSKEFKPGQ